MGIMRTLYKCRREVWKKKQNDANPTHVHRGGFAKNIKSSGDGTHAEGSFLFQLAAALGKVGAGSVGSWRAAGRSLSAVS